MKITLSQINLHPGNIESNCRKIIDEIRKASGEGSDIIIFPELSVTGYPPMDLLDSEKFIERTTEAVGNIAAECKEIAAVVGAPVPNAGGRGKKLFNSALFLTAGKISQIFNKALLPTYDVFDEYRYFEPSTDFKIVEWKGKRIAITICEDLWDEQPFDHIKGKASLYAVSPLEEISRLNPDLVINISASPFAHNRVAAREKIFSTKAKHYRVPVIMVNQTGANTDLIFDGASLVIDSNGIIKARLPFFREESFAFDLARLEEIDPSALSAIPEKIALIHDALVTGIRDYLAKTGQKKVVIGLSGGIDSAVCAALAAKALGRENVAGLMMPSRFSSDHSLKDAVDLAENLGINWKKIEIESPSAAFENILSDSFNGTTPNITEENIQARIRAVILMAWSNKFGHLVLNTSNKSEAATGYGTLYGDMAGALSVLGDVYKTDVWQLARYINRHSEIIPVSSITKPPSAELRENQLDSDSLPQYEILDQILVRYIEQVMDPESIIKEGFDSDTVHRVIKMVDTNEYKRYQAPPSLRISTKAFGPGRRIPLVSGYRFRH
ncbi:MAG: NAD+ synthase [Bacteroidales bacterium]|nr:NAD+ synthase [Bacteroidales bacterium]